MSCLSQGEEIANVWVWKWASNWSLLSHFSRVRLCATPETAAHQAPPSLGFSRQEQWSGLPFPSPINESEKWKWSHSVVSDSSWPPGLQPTRLLNPWDFPGKSMEWGAIAFSTQTLERYISFERDRTWVEKQFFEHISQDQRYSRS